MVSIADRRTVYVSGFWFFSTIPICTVICSKLVIWKLYKFITLHDSLAHFRKLHRTISLHKYNLILTVFPKFWTEKEPSIRKLESVISPCLFSEYGFFILSKLSYKIQTNWLFYYGLQHYIPKSNSLLSAQISFSRKALNRRLLWLRHSSLLESVRKK